MNNPPRIVVDSKDFQLLAALHENARQSFRALGSRVSLSAPAVRDRQDLLVFYQDERTREEAVKALAVRDVAFVAWKVDGGLTVQVWPRNQKESLEELARMLGEPSGQALAEHPPHRSLSLADWRIIDVLIDDPRIELERLCKSTGLSPKNGPESHVRHDTRRGDLHHPSTGSLCQGPAN